MDVVVVAGLLGCSVSGPNGVAWTDVRCWMMLAAHSPKTFYGFHEFGRRPGPARTDPIQDQNQKPVKI